MKPLHNKFILAGSAALLACSIGLAQPALAATKGVNVYRLYNTWSHEHLYTANLDEYNGLVAKGWNGEGVGFVAPEDGSDQVDGQVYRFFNPNNKEHLYTKDSAEVECLKTIGWKYEGVAWNSAKSDQTPVYRLFNPYVTEFTHYYTQNTTDRDENVARGMTNEGIHWYALTVTPEQNLDDALANLKSILANISASTSSTTTSVSAYELLNTTPESADTIVTAKTVEIEQVKRDINAKNKVLDEKKKKTGEKKKTLTDAQNANDTSKIPAAYAELAAAMADEASVNNEINALKSRQARLEQDIDEAQCGRANNQYNRISAICTSISNTKNNLKKDVEALDIEIKDLGKKKETTLYQDKKEIQKEIDAKTTAKTAKETAITKLNNLLTGYQATLATATEARTKEFAVMQQTSLVSIYTDKIAQAQSALEECKSLVASCNEAITKTNKEIEKINKENEGKQGYQSRPLKPLIKLEDTEAYKSATEIINKFTQDKTGAETARDNARTAAGAGESAAANTSRKGFKTLEEAIAKAEKEYSQKVYDILNPKKN